MIKSCEWCGCDGPVRWLRVTANWLYRVCRGCRNV